jgi:hypothetical protein
MAKKKNKRHSEHESFLAYRNYRYVKVSALICLVSIVGYFMTDFEPMRNGGTWYGYTLGTIAVLLILWLSLLGMRKRWISQGNWSLRAWTSAHVYLGLSLIIIATLHTGFQFAWNLHTLAYALMIVVIGSGLFGIYFYAVVPKRMSLNRGEMSQADMLDEVANLNRLLREAAQPLADNYIDYVQQSSNKTKLVGGFFKRASGKQKKCPTAAALKFFRAELRTVDNESHASILDLIAVLERKNALLHRVRRHIRHKTIMEGWLYLHIPFTFALIAALTAHIVSVFYYS